MSAPAQPQFGRLAPQYSFVFNPYPHSRVSRCPMCEGKTGQRKLPLLIHVDPLHLLALNYTCRYCSVCDLLVAHKHEIEHLLMAMFMQQDPTVIGNHYLVMGTMEKKAWREGMTHPKSVAEAPEFVHDFRVVYQDLRMTRPGWYGPGQKPPVMEPPPSQEWVKRR